MKLMKHLFYVFAYILFIAPPRAYTLRRLETENRGELAGRPIALVLLLESLVRAFLLLFVAVATQELVGLQWYTLLELDLLFGIFLCTGLMHSLSYFLFFYRNSRIQRATAYRYYRVLRNIFYSFLPGAVLIPIVLALQFAQKIAPVDLDLLFQIYVATTFVFFVVGLFEGALVSRPPSALEKDWVHRTEE